MSPETKIESSKRPWHALELPQILHQLTAHSEHGLGEDEAKNRLEKFGRNVLPEGKRITAFGMFLRQFTSPLVWILLIAAILTFLIDDRADSIVILVVVMVNALIGLFQEYRANKIFETLKAIVKVQAFVIRDGRVREINSEDLVPGDLILLKGGSKVPADARLVRSANLEVNEALLTGESKSVNKIPGLAAEKSVVGDRKNMVFTGTIIERGEGLGIVVATGGETEIGLITALTQSAAEELSPLQLRMKKLGSFLTELFIVISLAIFLVGLAEGDELFEMIKTTVAVAVAAIPEGLPAAISIILAVSSQNILKRKGLVRKLVAAETLGSTSVISSDKTGTLTYGVMRVEKIISAREPEVLLALALANEAIIEEREGKSVVIGESTDKAKLEKFLDSGQSLGEALGTMPRLALIPFEESRKYIASFHQSGKNIKVFVNGAPETVLNKCVLSSGERTAIQKSYENLAAQGYRLLAVAERNFEISKFRNGMPIDELVTFIDDLTFLGLAAIRDPIRTDVKEAMTQTRGAGIRVLMVTGDHILTAKAIGLELGFKTSADAVITGEQLDTLSDKELTKKIPHLEILARVTPVHKMRIIQAWQKLGAVVAMTGDGVNDAPALKAADIGVAIGSGTDVSKEASDLVLLDDSFATITAAIAEGRTGFANIRKATVAVMSNAFTEIVLIGSTLITHSPFPITAIQILWVNLAEDSLPVLAMAFEPREKDVMKSRPISPEEPILQRHHKFLIFVTSLIGDLILVGTFLYLVTYSAWPLQQIQSLVFVSAATPTLVNVFAFKSFTIPLHRIPLANNRFLIGAVLFGLALMVAAIYLPFLNRVLGTMPLPLVPALFAFVGFPLLKLLLVELTKWGYATRK